MALEIPRNKLVDPGEMELTEKVIKINRVAKVVKGGRRFSFNALSVVGDNNGHVGIGFGKANEVPDAIRKSVENAKKALVKVEIKNNTIPHEIVGRYKTSKVIFRPAHPGTGIKAGDAVRSVIETAGIKDILTKVHGSRNQINVVKAAFNGLAQLRNHFEVAKMRDISIYKLWGQPEPEKKIEQVSDQNENWDASQQNGENAEQNTEEVRSETADIAENKESVTD